jgi:glycosyltransferase involved in cell wall biosynthesis
MITEYGFETRAFAKTPKTALYCGFNTDRFRGDANAARSSVRREFGWPDEAKIVLVAGRMDQSPDLGHPQNGKNSGFALAVATRAALQDPRLHVVFAGAPNLSTPILESRAAAAGLSTRIQFAGVRRDMERLMLASDALLFPSRGEGLGMVAVEAQAAGLPVLASSAVPRECVVVPELVSFLDIEAGEEAWAHRLLRLTEWPRDVEAANRQVAASAFSIERSADALLRLYRNGQPA